MSFDIYNEKPKLVEPKLIKYFSKKFKQKELKAIEEVKEKEIEIITKKSTDNTCVWYKPYLNSVWEFIKENYGFFLITTLSIILLYVRYIEVTKRKQKMKYIIDQINEYNRFKDYNTNNINE